MSQSQWEQEDSPVPASARCGRRGRCRCCLRSPKAPMHRLWLSLLLATVLWVVLGTTFYMHDQKWDVYEAMFYSINVGLGVGYGQFQVVGSNGKMFTVAYCIMGASLIAGAGALAVQAVLLRQFRMDDQALYPWRHPHASWLDPSNVVHKPKGWARVRRRCSKYRFRIYTCLFWLLWVAIGMAFSAMGHLECPDESEYDGRNWSLDMRVSDCEGLVEAIFFVITSMSTAAQVPPRRCLPPEGYAETFQCTFANHRQNDGVITCDPPCTTDNFSLGFTAVYIFIGIPLFGALMGFAADIYISRFQRRQARQSASSGIAAMDVGTFAEMAHINIEMTPRVELVEDGTDAIRVRTASYIAEHERPTLRSTSESRSASREEADSAGPLPSRTVPWYYVVTASREKAILWGEFLEYQLTVLDAVKDRKLLHGLKRDFRNLDRDEKGYLTMEDIQAANLAQQVRALGRTPSSPSSANMFPGASQKAQQRAMDYEVSASQTTPQRARESDDHVASGGPTATRDRPHARQPSGGNLRWPAATEEADGGDGGGAPSPCSAGGSAGPPPSPTPGQPQDTELEVLV